MRVISENEFRERLYSILDSFDTSQFGSVTGPGRSGAVAAVYTSHYLGIPFIPYKSKYPENLGKLLIVDTARQSGETLRKASRKYGDAFTIACFEEPPRVAFWYEAKKPQRYKHECMV